MKCCHLVSFTHICYLTVDSDYTYIPYSFLLKGTFQGQS